MHPKFSRKMAFALGLRSIYCKSLTKVPLEFLGESLDSLTLQLTPE